MEGSKRKLAIISICTLRGQIADFMYYLIKELFKFYDSIWLVSSYDFSEDTHKRLRKKVDKILEGILGDDFEHWKAAVSILQNELIDDFEDITFLNDSFYGPIYPIKEIWNTMMQKETDFWGITRHQAFKTTDAFIQTYFINFKTFVVKEALINFLSEKEDYENLEFNLTSYLEQRGYISDVYVRTEDLENRNNDLAESFLLFYPYELVKYRKCPFVSRFMFSLKEEQKQLYGDGMQIPKILEFIESRYPIEYIYSDLLYQHNMYHLIHTLDLNFVVGRKNKFRVICKWKTAVFIYLYYESDFKFYVDKIANIPRGIDIYIYTDEDRKLHRLKELLKGRIKTKLFIVESIGREWAVFLNEVKVQAGKYYYACFMHDKTFHSIEFPTQAYAFRDLLWDNLLPNSAGIDEIIHIFESNKHIGVLLPPIVKHGSYFKYYMNFWINNFENTCRLADKIGIRSELFEAGVTPISLGGMFWFRPAALRLLFEGDFRREIFEKEPLPLDGTLNHALERIIPYAAQEVGYYSGVVISTFYLKHDWLVQSEMIRMLGKNSDIEFNFMCDLGLEQ